VRPSAFAVLRLITWPNLIGANLPQAQDALEHPQVLGADLNRSESSRPSLPFAPPHSATASCSKGRLIRCTVPGLTPTVWQ
jgi:hypothetical protein